MSTVLRQTRKFIFLAFLWIAALPASRAQQQTYQSNDQNSSDYIDYDDANAQDNGSVSLQTFYDDLGPYGQWVQDPYYGYVWVPDVGSDFRPYYTNGHWAMTDYGNTWVSDYDWGWAPFHYGRWTYDNYYGWIWIPGTTWGPAWVSWRDGGGYYGWAPLGPNFNIGMGFGAYDCPEDWWVFIQPEYLYRHDYYRYWHPRNNSMIINNTTVVNNTYVNTRNNVTYVTGPRSADIEKATNRPVKVYHIANLAAPLRTKVKNDEVRMYHPMNVVKTQPGGAKPAPSDVVRAPQPVGNAQPAVEQKQTAFQTQVLQRAASQQVSEPQQRGRYEYNPQTAPSGRALTPAQNDNGFNNNQNFSRPSAPAPTFSRPAAPAQNFSRPAPAPAAHFEAHPSGGGGFHR